METNNLRKILAAASLVLAMGLQFGGRQLEAAKLSEQMIWSQLRSPEVGPNEALALLRTLGATYNEDGLNVALLLEQNVVSEKKCEFGQLLDRYEIKSALVYDLGEMEPVLRYLELRFSEQLETCLEKLVSTLDKNKRRYVELYHDIANSFRSDESLNKMGPLSSDDLVDFAAGKFVLERRQASTNAISKLAKSKGRLRDSLESACDETLLKLKQFVGFIGFSRPDATAADQVKPELKRWQQIYHDCEDLKRRFKFQLDWDEIGRVDI